ncbi:type I glyceraldehyde-3-phosphate dehydrogenase [Pedobacter flavus]|uniref:Glyceraldehyde-3-phosphate dehydrogenase n=1 Tax=Pedobacter flavus TaxID=3113906 RepID=A0ABU7GY51_9SPHI|nr:type I glyceraldehyde-3-phosphate dehydrogenase [Pedobacter sp. VNH31]MEE1883900.1 type I glyceraldehyde-3-phosphate dehydrogenase [Pedobacter sp. VNH31]
MFRISINGFGRIGRTFLRNALSENLNVVAINDLAPPSTLAHLFRYDSVHGLFNGEVSSDEQAIYINGNRIEVFNQPNTELIPWDNIHLVIESTGKNLDYDRASKHLQAGAKQVLISAPAADNIPMVVLGVNDATQIIQEPIFSAASCTTNNIAPIIKVLHEKWGVKEGYITTVHSMTGDQNLHDAPHHDLRRARAAGSSIIPTTTGAAKAITKIFPDLEKKLGGAGIRVPVLNGSLTDLTCILNKKATVQEINEEIKFESETNLKGIVEYINEPIVSVDILNNRHSCIFDAMLTSVVGDLVKVVGWYDNESGYSSRLVDLAKMVQKKYD